MFRRTHLRSGRPIYAPGGPTYAQEDLPTHLPSLCPIYNPGGLLYDPPGGPLTLL